MIQVVVSDTNILINLCYADALALLGRIPEARFIIPVEVEREMRRGRGRRFADTFSRAMNTGVLSVEDAAGVRAIEVYVRCLDDYGLDQGESAAMALAASHNYYFATTEVSAYDKAMIELGEDYVVHLEDIIDLAVARAVLPLEEATELRLVMAECNGYRGWEGG